MLVGIAYQGLGRSTTAQCASMKDTDDTNSLKAITVNSIGEDG